MIKESLKAAGIRRVIWIDDFFSRPSRDDLVERIFQHLLRMKELGYPDVEFGPDARISLEVSSYEIQEACDELLSELNDSDIEILEVGLLAYSGIVSATTELEPDLSPEDFAALKDAFGAGLETFSVARWTTAGATALDGAGGDTLFVVDKQFNRENPGFDGVTLLKDLVEKTTAFCILLTHTCNEGDQDRERLATAKAGGLSSHRFCVLSKQQGGSGDVKARFARAIYGVITFWFTGEMADTIRKSIKNTADETAERLAAQSVFDLDQAFFENSYPEGVRELDVLVRIFNIEQRSVLNAALKNATVQAQLRRVRVFRQKAGSVRPTLSRSDLTMSTFRDWRRREVIKRGAGLNEIHAPLSCGDIFESVDEKRERFVFLGQPCDLMVRENGKRRTAAGLLVTVTATNAPSGQEMPYRFFDIGGVFGADERWRVDFRSSIVVDVSIIDFCIFNRNDVVGLLQNQQEPDILLSPGWLKRFSRAKKEIATRTLPQPLALGASGERFSGALIDGGVRYPIQRTGRLESATAMAILAGWATFQTRAALEHDFASEPPQPAGGV